MERRPLFALFALVAMFVPGPPALCQSGTGQLWDSFGPDRAAGNFFNITREHLSNQNAQGIAVDRRQRVLVLNEWDESGNSNTDCAVTRHIRDARLLDMDYTGPEQLEATRRIAMDMGGSNVDSCAAIDADSLSRAVIVGGGDYGGNSSGFVIRLDADGDYDTGFSTDGKLALKNLAAFAGVNSRLNHVAVDAANRILACGYVERGGSRNMLVVRFTTSGLLDTSFSTDGHVEIDFNVAGVRNDICSRLLLLPDGNVLLGGIATGADGNPAYGLARLTDSGSFVSGFGSSGRLLVDDGSVIAATPTLADLAYDAGRDRFLIGCTLTIASTPNGCVIALGSDGSFDTSFDDDGRLGFRYSNYGQLLGSPLRDPGGTRVKRILPRDDGSFYVVGTHYNSDADVAIHGVSDVATLRLQVNGGVTTGGPTVYANDGVRFHAFDEVRAPGVSEAADRRVAEVLVDATWLQGNLLLLADRPRYPTNVFDHDDDGILDEPGPVAPLIAGVEAERLFGDDFEFDGLDRSTGLQPQITVPAGFGNYCSVRNPANGSNYGFLTQGAGSDPCQQLLDVNPDLIVDRSGLYSLAGRNWVLGTCDGNFITVRPGNGTAPASTAFADTAGRSNCVFTMAPEAMPIFSRPHDGGSVDGTQAFNHDVYNIPLDVSEFGQTPGAYDACYIDNVGRQRSTGNPLVANACQSTGGVNEPAADIPVTNDNGPRYAISMAPGRVVMAVPRHVPMFAPAGMDPYQREVFVRHQVGNGRYAEIFTTYYAHMRYTAARRGDTVSSGTVLGRIGTTGSSTGEHLHISTHRHRNLSWRGSFEFNFVGGQHDRDGSLSAVDPWGWDPPIADAIDPWVYRFRAHPGGNTALNNAGAFSTRLWIAGEAPPLP